MTTNTTHEILDSKIKKTIWKFILPQQRDLEIDMPIGAEILCAREQGNEVCIWAVVDPSANLTKRSFLVIGSGHEVPDDPELKYLGTGMLYAGSIVLHVFESLAGNLYRSRIPSL